MISVLIPVMTYGTRIMDPWSVLLHIPVLTFIWIAFLILYAWIFLWHEIRVYRWGFPCLDYSFDVLFSWDRDLSVYNQSCYHLHPGFPALWILRYTRFHIYFICVLTLLSFEFDTCVPPGSPPGIDILAWGVPLTPLDSYVQVMEPERVDPSFAAQISAAVAWISSRPLEPHPSRPLWASRVST